MINKENIVSVEKKYDLQNRHNTYKVIFNVDKVLGVRIENDNFYKHDGFSLRALNKPSSLKLERDDIFREINHTFLISKKAIKKNNLKIGHIVLSQLSSFSIRTDFDFEIAQKLTRIN